MAKGKKVLFILALAALINCTGPVVVRSQIAPGFVRAQGYSREENSQIRAELRIFGTVVVDSIRFDAETPKELAIDYQSDQTIVKWVVPTERIGKWDKAPYFILGQSKEGAFKIRIDCQTKSSLIIETLSFPRIPL